MTLKLSQTGVSKISTLVHSVTDFVVAMATVSTHHASVMMAMQEMNVTHGQQTTL